VIARSKYIKISPWKLRPIVDGIRGRSLGKSLALLNAHMTKRVKPIIKALNSAYANAKNKNKEIDSPDMLVIKKIFIDQGPVLKYFKPAAMGRASVQRRRLSHISVELETVKEAGKQDTK